MKYILLLLLLLVSPGILGQTSMQVNASLAETERKFIIEHSITYENTGNTALNEIYLNDWANAFSSKTTPLARRFAEEFARRFHFAKEDERGETYIESITSNDKDSLFWERPFTAPDIVRIRLPESLLPGEKTTIHLNYIVKIPSDKFTRFGVNGDGTYKIRYWFLTPAVFDDENGWQLYSHRNLDNRFSAPFDVEVDLEVPSGYYPFSSMNLVESTNNNGRKNLKFSGKSQVETKLYLTKSVQFESVTSGKPELITNVEDDGLAPPVKRLITDRIFEYLNSRMGEYPHDLMLITQEDYLSNPVYGLNQLPGFIRPFPDGFQYDIKMLKTITNHYLKNTILINPRYEQWVHDAILVSVMMDYVDTYYPNMRLLGNLSHIIGIRWFHAADLEFNDQYQFLYMNMARLNLDQPLTMAQDSLVKFNVNIANAYKAGVGMRYLEDFLGNGEIQASIREFYQDYLLKPASSEDFQRILLKNSSKDISWFFGDYLQTNKKIDFRISGLQKQKDSLVVEIKNKRKNNFPISLYGLKDGEIVSKTWVTGVRDKKTVKIARDSIDRLALNYEATIPEFNQRDNYRRVTKLFNKPLQFRLLQDVEDPRYTQLFFMPEFDYNLYDGISIGPKLYNKTILNKTFDFKIAPKYGFNSETIVGSASLVNTHQFRDKELHAIRYGISGTRFSYGYNLFYEKYTPFLAFSFRRNYLRNNERQQLMIRNVNVRRDELPEAPLEQPNYNVFNINYRYSNPHLVDFYAATFDFQLADKFSKISASLEYRKLFRNNRQINLRFFTGTFLYSDVTDNNYFSFALDRPTDYLFDYNYYGRSQGSGLFSQQIIVAEGGFKSQLQPEFANQWITTLNGSTNLWKWIFVYGDVGLVKNKHENAAFMYDSGIRLSLVDDYFEIFFPVYSNLGWEIAQPDYDQKIRFIVSLDVNTLIRLFTRRWY
ncbi:metalloprotease [Salegentibacter sp. HM20]